MPVVVPYREGKFIKADATVSRLLTTQEDDLFVPGVEEAVHFDVEHFPPQLSRVTAPARQVLLPLLYIANHTFTKTPLLADSLYFLAGIRDWWVGTVYSCSKLPDRLVADFLADDELVFADLLV